MQDRVVNWFKRLVPSKGAPASLDELVKREFGLRIKNKSHYEEALTHASLLDGDVTGLKSNERLEFLGDCALDLSVATYLFAEFPEDQEGGLTQRKSKIVNRKTLNLLGERMGIPLFIRSKMRRQDIQDTVVGNALEALIGAIYLDHGFEKTSKAVLRMLKRHGADEKVHQTIDFKSKLFHWSQSRKKRLDFRVVSEASSDGESVYVMQVLVDGKVFGEAEGRSKKIAEQAASRVAWKEVFDRGLNDEGEEPAPDPQPDNGRPRGPRGKGSREKAQRSRQSEGKSERKSERKSDRKSDREPSRKESSDRRARGPRRKPGAEGDRPDGNAVKPVAKSEPRLQKQDADSMPPQSRRRMRRPPADS